MEIYFVRHGQTGGNVARRHQAEETPLTELGKEQVIETVALLKQFEPTHLISSSYIRTLESARVIAEAFDLPMETSFAFVELHRPKTLYGYYHIDPRSIWYIVRWFFARAGSESESTEGESYAALRGRIAAAQAKLAEYPEDARVVVVSHSIFINFFVAHMCHKKPMSLLQAARAWRRIRRMKNASITKVRYTALATGCSWQLVPTEEV